MIVLTIRFIVWIRKRHLLDRWPEGKKSVPVCSNRLQWPIVRRVRCRFRQIQLYQAFSSNQTASLAGSPGRYRRFGYYRQSSLFASQFAIDLSLHNIHISSNIKILTYKKSCTTLGAGCLFSLNPYNPDPKRLSR